jgi:hypothetical protein
LRFRSGGSDGCHTTNTRLIVDDGVCLYTIAAIGSNRPTISNPNIASSRQYTLIFVFVFHQFPSIHLVVMDVWDDKLKIQRVEPQSKTDVGKAKRNQ